MVVKIAGHWEFYWQAPINEYDLWIHPLREYGIDEFYMCPVSGIQPSHVLERASIADVLLETPELTKVYVDENAETSLSDFVHPDNALYIFGKTSYSPYLIHKTDADLSVKIDSVRNNGGFWSHQAAALVLHDRYTKRGF